MKTKNTGIHSVYIGNLSFKAEEPQILQIFKPYGYIKNIKIMREGKENKSKGFAFVDMVNITEAQKAVEALNGTSYHGRTLKVSIAKTQNFKAPEEIQERKPSKNAILNQAKKQKRLNRKDGLQALFSRPSKK